MLLKNYEYKQQRDEGNTQLYGESTEDTSDYGLNQQKHKWRLETP